MLKHTLRTFVTYVLNGEHPNYALSDETTTHIAAERQTHIDMIVRTAFTPTLTSMHSDRAHIAH